MIGLVFFQSLTKAYAEFIINELGPIRVIEACYNPSNSMEQCLNDPMSFKNNGSKCLLGDFSTIDGFLDIYQYANETISFPAVNSFGITFSPINIFPKVKVENNPINGYPKTWVSCRSVSKISNQGMFHELLFYFTARKASTISPYGPTTTAATDYTIKDADKIACAKLLLSHVISSGASENVCMYASALPFVSCLPIDGLQTKIKNLGRGPSRNSLQKYKSSNIRLLDGVVSPLF